MKELHHTLRYFGFKPTHADTINTQPSRENLAHYHRLLGQKVLPFTARQRLQHGVYNFLKQTFPQHLANNLLVIAQKELLSHT